VPRRQYLLDKLIMLRLNPECLLLQTSGPTIKRHAIVGKEEVRYLTNLFRSDGIIADGSSKLIDRPSIDAPEGAEPK